MYDFSGRVVLVTGAARGQGEATARAFAELSATVLLADVLVDEGEAVAAELGPAASFVRLDVADGIQWADLIEQVGRLHGRLDVLINNAGIFHREPLPDTDQAVMERLFRVNQLGPWLGMRACLPLLIESTGSIVNVASTAGVRGVANVVAYSSTKWAVRGLTRAAAIEFAPHGIRVNCVIPGLIDTPMAHQNEPAALREFLQLIPLRRLGRPAEVATASVYLASDQAGYITGTDLIVDGGDTA